MSTTWTWVLGLGLAGCDPITKNGGEILDTDSGDEDGDAIACDAAPVCGNGVVEQLEECDGDEGCEACRRQVDASALGGSDDIHEIVFAPDGSWLATTVDGTSERPSEEADVLRRYDAAGNELWSHELGAYYGDIALGSDGRVYYAGILQGPDVLHAGVISAWDPDGTPLWSLESEDPSTYSAITVSGDRIAVVGSQYDGEVPSSYIRTLDTSGADLWSVGDGSSDGFMDAELIGNDLAVISSLDQGLELDVVQLRRYDALATVQWSYDLPTDFASIANYYQVTGDGAGGTWTYGSFDLKPHLVHHDADGGVLEILDCFGPHTAFVRSLAVDGSGRLALAINVELGLDSPFESHAWFPIVQDGEVISATELGAETSADGVAWRGTGLVTGWTDTVLGRSTLVLHPE